MTGTRAVSFATARMTALALQAASLVLLAAFLPQRDFGVFALVLLVQGLISVVVNLGMFTSNQYHAARGELELERVVTASLLATVAATVLFIPPTSFVLSWLHPVLLPGLSLDLLVLAVMAGPVRLAVEALLGAFVGTGNVGAQVRVVIVAPLGFVLGLLVLLAVGQLTLEAAVRVWLLSHVLALAAALVEFRRGSRLAPPVSVRLDRRLWSRIIHLGAAGYVVYVIFWASVRLERFALDIVGGPQALGAFALAAWISESFNLLPGSTANAIYPRVAVAPLDERRQIVSRAVRSTILVLAALVAPTVLGAWVLSETIIGARYPETVPLLALLLPGQVAFAPISVLASYSVAIGRPLLGGAYFAVTAVLKVALVLALFPPSGLLGVAAAFTIASWLVGLVASAHLARLLRSDVSALVLPRGADVRAMLETASIVTRLR